VHNVVILGIDPGYGRCGWGLVEMTGNRLRGLDYGVIETSAKSSFPDRLKQLYDELQAVIKNAGPDESAIEELFFSKNAKTAINVGQARGVAVLSCCQAGLPVAEYKPVQIKMAVSGFGMAAKPQIQQMVKILLGLRTAPKMDDAADALAVAICHAHSRTLARLTSR
jgi:crossover junction endodeoxyribonuclease RuvC